MNFSGFNIWEVLLSASAAFATGFAWYSPLLFGKSWQQLAGLSDEDMQEANMKLIFGLAFILMFIIALFMSLFIEIVMMVGSGALIGALFGGFLSLIFVATTMGVNYLFARRPLKLYLIDAGYMVVTFMIMGAIMGAWN